MSSLAASRTDSEAAQVCVVKLISGEGVSITESPDVTGELEIKLMAAGET